MDWSKCGYVIASKYRKKVLEALRFGPKTPRQIASETELHLSHTSWTLTELVAQGIVLCLTPQLRRGRLYRLTNEGIEIAEYIEKQSKGSLPYDKRNRTL
jgi:predicted transcriptional regulator